MQQSITMISMVEYISEWYKIDIRLISSDMVLSNIMKVNSWLKYMLAIVSHVLNLVHISGVHLEKIFLKCVKYDVYCYGTNSFAAKVVLNLPAKVKLASMETLPARKARKSLPAKRC